MRRGIWAVSLFSLVFSLPASGQSYELVWQDEFDGTSLDLGRWQPQIGNGCPSLCGWGNNELQYYRTENATVADGFLTITAKEESFAGADYTSARLRTRNLGDWRYGRFEMRAKMPIGQGLWPAFWMLPTDEVYGVWAASGEIDIMEYLGHQPSRVLGTIHYGGTWPGNVFTGDDFFLASGTFNDDFHEFALEWDACEIRWFVDGELYQTQTSWWSEGGPYPAPFDERFHLLLNVAVGGNLPGPPDGTTVFPQEMVVDYVRVYQEPDLTAACTCVFDGMDHANPFANGWFIFNGIGGGGINGNLVDLPPVQGCRASLESGWGSGGNPGFFGGFGRTRPLDLTDQTHFTMWINPDLGQTYTLEINLQDDDNGDNSIPISPDGADDEFDFDFQVSPTGPHAVSGAGWQRVSIPLGDFEDDNSFHFGGNGVFDPVPTGAGGNGQLINVVIAVISPNGDNVTFRTDRWAFTRQTSSISGRVWDDADGDGNEDAGEIGLEGVTLFLRDAIVNAVVDTQVTAVDGTYQFDELLAGPFEVIVDVATVPVGYVSTHDPDGVLTPNRFSLDLECDQAAEDQNIAYAPESVDVPGAGRVEALLRNVPNPSNPRTVIEFELSREGPVELTVYDVTGRRVISLLRERRAAGSQRVEWNGDDERGRPVAPGVYYYTLRTDAGRFVRRMALFR